MINNRQGGGRRRGRGGGSGPQRSNNPNPGNRQDNRQRGNAAQLLEKYKGLARDAQMQGDRVLTETYHQYADHYFRVLNESRARFEEQRRQRDDYEDEGDGEDYETEGNEAEGRDESGRDEPRYEEQRPRRDEPRYEEQRPRREQVARREEREERPDRGGEERGERNGEYRAQRRPRTRRPEADEDEGQGDRLSLDVLPPAISAANEDSAPEEEKPVRARRPRRPRAADEDIAPAA